MAYTGLFEFCQIPKMLENAFESGSGFEPLNQQMALAADWASFDIQIKNLFNWDLDINFKSNRKNLKKDWLLSLTI